MRIIAARGSPFRSVEDLWARAGVGLATIERLAAADTFRSLGRDRRQALWAAKGLPNAPPLPLFEWCVGVGRSEDRAAVRSPTGAVMQPSDTPSSSRPALSDFGREGAPSLRPTPTTSDLVPEPDVRLPEMPLGEHVVADYQTLRLSLKAHPMALLRERFARPRTRTCAGLAELQDGARVAVAGVVLVRQRPGSAKGVVFMTIEDETGVANAVIWPKTLERFRRQVMGARLVLIEGRIQSLDTGSARIIHVVASRLTDRSDWLSLLAAHAPPMPVPIARADEVLRPEPGSTRDRGDAHARHPRDVRILPRSRDFH